MKLSGSTDVVHGGLKGRVFASGAPSAADHSQAIDPELTTAAPGRVPPSYVLLHGIGVSHRYLARLHLHLAKTAKVYTFDLPGFGGAPAPREQVQVEQYADFVAAALTGSVAGASDEIPPGGFIVVGHSMGTQFAVELALRHPHLVSGVVLMSPVVDPKRGTALQQAADLTKDALFCESPSSNATVFTDYLRAGPRWYLTELPVMLAYPLIDRIPQVQQPVLVVRGSRDPVARGRWCRELVEAAPHGTLAEVPGKGHVVQHTGTVAVATAITAWESAGSAGSRQLPRQ